MSLLRRLIIIAIIAVALIGTAISIHDLLDSRRTIVFDQIYAQNQMENEYGRDKATIIAQRYGYQLVGAFGTESECSGLSFSRFVSNGLSGKPGRWRIKIDIAGSEDPDSVPSLQRWSLIQPNRDGGGNSDTLIVKTTGTPAEIMKAVCEVVKNDVN